MRACIGLLSAALPIGAPARAVFAAPLRIGGRALLRKAGIVAGAP